MRTELSNLSSSPVSSNGSNGSLLSIAQQVLTDIGWEDLRPAMVAVEEVGHAIAQELKEAHAAYAEEPEAGQRQRLQAALDKAIDQLQSDVARVNHLKAQAEQRLSQSRTTEAFSFSYASLFSGWLYNGLQQFFGSDDASLITRYSEIAQNRRESLAAFREYQKSLMEAEPPSESESESKALFPSHARQLLTVDSDEFRVNTYMTGAQYVSSIAALSDGGFVITWTSYGQDGDGRGVYAQRYSVSNPSNGEFRVNTVTTSDQHDPSIAALSDGGFVIAWSSNGQDGSDYGVYAQRYSGSGGPSGGEFRVNTYTLSGQGGPSIAALSDGGFVIAWSSDGQDSSGSGVYAQCYSASGSPSSSEFRFMLKITAFGEVGYNISPVPFHFTDEDRQNKEVSQCPKKIPRHRFRQR